MEAQATPPGRITDPAAIRNLVTAGCATFTVVSTRTGTRFTYKVEAPQEETDAGGLRREADKPLRFVKVLTGPDNTSDYRYAGTLRPDGGHWEGLRFTHGGQKAKLREDVPSVLGFGWLVAALRANAVEKLAQVEFWHEGKCCRCGRKLTDPESVSRGLGPECAGRALS